MIIDIIRKSVLQTFRRRGNIITLFLMPVIFFGFFGFIFSPSSGNVTRELGYINLDQGSTANFKNIIPENFKVVPNPDKLSTLFLNLLSDHLNLISDSQVKIHLVQYTDKNYMIKDIQTQNLAIGIIIPVNFTKTILSNYNEKSTQLENLQIANFPSNVTSKIVTYGDPSVSEFQSTYSIFIESLKNFSNSIYGTQVFTQNSITGGYLSFVSTNVKEKQISNFEQLVPGFLVFFVILQMISASSQLTDEKEQQTVSRIKLSKMKNWEFITGILISRFIFMTIQFIFMVGVVWLFNFTASFLIWFYVFIILQITNIAISGIGFIIASFVKTEREASSIAAITSAPIGFLSGSFMPVPTVWIIKSLNFQFWDLIPTFHSDRALIELFFPGELEINLFREIIFLIAFAIVIILVGLFVYNKRVINADTK